MIGRGKGGKEKGKGLDKLRHSLYTHKEQNSTSISKSTMIHFIVSKQIRSKEINTIALN